MPDSWDLVGSPGKRIFQLECAAVGCRFASIGHGSRVFKPCHGDKHGNCPGTIVRANGSSSDWRVHAQNGAQERHLHIAKNGVYVVIGGGGAV